MGLVIAGVVFMKQVLTLFTSLAVLLTFTNAVSAMEKEDEKSALQNITIDAESFDEVKQKYAKQNTPIKPIIEFYGDANLFKETLKIFPNIERLILLDNKFPFSLFENTDCNNNTIHWLYISNSHFRKYNIPPECPESFSTS